MAHELPVDGIELGQVHRRTGTVPGELLIDASIDDGSVRLYALLHMIFGSNPRPISRREMGDLLGVTEKTITNRTARLEAANWIVVIHRSSPEGRQANVYHIFEDRDDCRLWQLVYKNQQKEPGVMLAPDRETSFSLGPTQKEVNFSLDQTLSEPDFLLLRRKRNPVSLPLESVVVDPDPLSRSENQQQQRDPTPAERETFRDLLLNEPVWREWMEHPPEYVLACALHASEEQGVNNRVGLLRAMLEQGKGAPGKQYMERATRLLAGEPEPEPYAEAAAHNPVPGPPPPVTLPDPALDALAGSSPFTWRQVWLAVRGQLELQLNRQTFEVLRDAHLMGVADGVLTIQVRRVCDAAKLTDRDPASEHLSRLAGQPVTVRYVSAEAEVVHV